ncbi:FAD-dependent oxidoreductase [Pseudonocardia acidicola]|uniref:FAD-dependent oxidoreductase n=1 Tax=Pseudonocardia acidicola TaxID=2724939 RepID=A0ABX1SE75_9PSEU|nr:FAD-dependent oxidoreductase [Pseudonocardia acidicola]
MSGPTTLVVGSSIGGVRTAQALRAAGYAGEVVLIGEEQRLPYDKPPLSKAVLAGAEAGIALLTDDAAREAGLRLLLGRRAERLDVAASELELDGGERLGFDDLVVATGASARPAPWGTGPGVHVLRTLDDACAVREDLLAGGHLVVVGGGFVGAEVAATARTLGLQVSMVDPVEVPMSRLLGIEVGRIITGLHERHGVATYFGAGVADIAGERGALRVTLTDGRVIEASTVVVGIGATPNDGWLASSGLLVEDGLVCDEHCRALDEPRVHAVGDVARWWHPRHGARVRVEHWTNAVEQAALVAHNIVHPDDLRAYAPVEYVWSDQYDWKIQIAGRTGTAHHEIIGDPTTDPRFAVLYTDAGDSALSGLVTVNWPRALVAGRKALAAGAGLAELRSRLHEQPRRRRPAPPP